jgi:hypothetical protein
MQANTNDLIHLKNNLLDYATSTRLKINFEKSNLIPINISNQRAQELANIFGCAVASMPFTYLGLPMGTTKPAVIDLLPLLSRIERKVTSSTLLMSHDRKLAYVNAIITSIANFTMCTIEINPKILQYIEKMRRRVLWSEKTDDGEKCVSLAACDIVCRPHDKGGLGVLNLKIQNQGLLLKFLDIFYNKKDIQWVNLIWQTYYQNSIPHASNMCGSFWCKSIMKLSPIFRGIASCKINNGHTTLFWKDEWNSRIMQELYPCLYSNTQDKDISVADFCYSENKAEIFHCWGDDPRYAKGMPNRMV